VPTITVTLLGGFGAAVDGEPVPERAWRLKKARELVKLLALAPGHRLHREQAMDVLWRDRDPAEARAGCVAATRLEPACGSAPALDRLSYSSRMVELDDVRALAATLPRSAEALVRGRVKFRVGRIVYLAFSRDETEMGFAFPKEWREALVESEPEKFRLPGRSDLRYIWAVVRLAAIDLDEMRDLVLDAWSMVVPKRVAAEYAGAE
jgi:hypothetical protein